MNVRTILMSGIALCMIGCAAEDAPQTPIPAVEQDPWKADAFVQHMHRHARQIDKLNLALAEGDFDGAMTPAYWLSRHDAVDGIPPELQKHLQGMRAAARDVEESTDFDTARTAAEQITVHCQGCHAAANVDADV